MKEIMEHLYQGKNLTATEMTQAAHLMFSGALTESQIGAFLGCLKQKGTTAVEMAALAKVMQTNAVKIQDVPAGAMDNCGTGGDHSNSFNISTTAAFVLAGGGIPMAKHGNRSISSRSGSADVLEVLGVDITPSTQQISYLLQEVGIAFLFAPAMHPTMRFVSKVRQELATPTILNLIGPLTNPVPLESQLMGTFAGNLLHETAETLGQLGRKRAVVLHGAQGMDEANLADITRYALYDGQVSEHSITPEEVGLAYQPLAAIVGGDAQANAQILLSVLKNEASPYLDTVLLNAGLGFFAHGNSASVAAGIQEARQVIASGAAMDKLQQLLKLQEAA